jgi:hypothetical protein
MPPQQQTADSISRKGLTTASQMGQSGEPQQNHDAASATRTESTPQNLKEEPSAPQSLSIFDST